MNADVLTILRAIAGLPIALAITSGHRDVAFVLFTLAAASDAVDGWVARRAGPTARGALLDPLADKALVLSVLAALVVVAVVPLWLFALIAGREAFVAGLRIVSVRDGARTIAKAKTVLEMCAVGAVLAVPGAAANALLIGAAVLAIATLPTYFARATQAPADVR